MSLSGERVWIWIIYEAHHQWIYMMYSNILFVSGAEYLFREQPAVKLILSLHILLASTSEICDWHNVFICFDNSHFCWALWCSLTDWPYHTSLFLRLEFCHVVHLDHDFSSFNSHCALNLDIFCITLQAEWSFQILSMTHERKRYLH